MNKIKNSKGFTLMEMLIVVAIIAVLVAIAIPTFTKSLNDARVATDKANIRAGYASVMANVLTEQYVESKTAKTTAVFKLNKDGSVTEIKDGTATAENPYLTVGDNDGKATEIAGITIADGWGKGEGVTYTYTFASGKVTIAVG